MFGLKLFARAKTKKFASEKKRKQYFAIQAYYQQQSQTGSSSVSIKKKSAKNK